MIKAVFFDIDGTLLVSGLGTLPASAKKALYDLKKKGILIFIASGRHICEIQKQPMYDIPFDGYVLLNGQIGLNKQKEVMFEYPIDKRDQLKLIEIFNQKGISLMLVEKNRLYINCIKDQVYQAQGNIASELPIIEKYRGDVLYQATAFVGEKQAKELMEQLPYSKMTRWNSYGIDIIAKEGGKKKGIESILQIYQLSWDEVMSFGDGENDKEMLLNSKIGVAMQNGNQEVQEVSDYVTACAEKDGIIKALRHFQILP